MIFTTFQSTQVALLTVEPDGQVKGTVSRLADLQAGRTRREERRILGAKLRWKLEYSGTVVDRVTAQAMRLTLRAWDNRPVLCPLWIAAKPYGQALLFTAPIKVTYEPDFATWELHTGSTPTGFTPSAMAMTAPVLWGVFEKLPDPSLLTTEIPTFSCTFVSGGKAQWSVEPAPAVVVTLGPDAHGQQWPLADFDLDYKTTKSGGVEIQVSRERIGYGLDQTETFYPQSPRSTNSTSVQGDELDLARLIATFHACAGTARPLWFPSGYSPTRLTSDIAAGAQVLQVENGGALGGHKHLLLRDFSGADVPVVVNSVVSNTVNLDRAPGPFKAEGISLQLLFFGRFGSDELPFTWESPLAISSNFTLTELPPDYGAPAGETYGTTLGCVGAPIHLFEIADQVGGAWYWTNYEDSISVDGNLYEPHQVAWDQITERLYMDDGKLTLTCDSWEGNPLRRLTLPRRGQVLSLVLKEWDAGGAGSPVKIWSGSASSASWRGRVLKIPFSGSGRAFNISVPRRLDGPSCPWVIYGPGCELTPASKRTAATTMSQSAPLQIVVSVSGSLAGNAFAGGWLKRPDGLTWGILDSTATSGGTLTLTLDGLMTDFAAGQAWDLFPGCDCSWTACDALGNTDQFGGAPRKPASNPAFTPVKSTTAGGSKK